MRVIIAGTRDLCLVGEVATAVIESGFDITTVLSGKCAGIDKAGELWAAQHNIPVEAYPALWKVHGTPKAAHIRNQQMVDNADALIALPRGFWSRGTYDVIGRARKKGIPIHIRKI